MGFFLQLTQSQSLPCHTGASCTDILHKLSSPLSNTQASVFQAALKCTIWHYRVAMNLLCVFYNKRACIFLAIAEATE